MDDAASFLSHDKDASILVEEKEYDRILYSPNENNQIVLCQAPQTYEDLDSIYYQYEFWNNNAYLIFSENNSENSTGTFNKCLYNPDTKCKKIRNYFKSKKDNISVYFHEKFFPSSFGDLKNTPSLNKFITKGTLKSCSPFFDTYIYQWENHLYWIVGADLQPKDQAIYNLYPPRREYLSRERSYDNRSFYISTKNEAGHSGKYRLFQRPLPKEYPVKIIVVGFLIGQKPILFKSFYPSKY